LKKDESYFKKFILLIADSHNAEYKIDYDKRYIEFISDNVTEQLSEDVEKLFWEYLVRE